MLRGRHRPGRGGGAHAPDRRGALVLSNTFRHPAVLANIAASLDHVAEGRFTLGLGAGWLQSEHDGYALPFSTTRDRIERLESRAIDRLHAYVAVGVTHFIIAARPPYNLEGLERFLTHVAARMAVASGPRARPRSPPLRRGAEPTS